MLEPLTGDTMRQDDGNPLEDARKYIRQALGALMEVSDKHKQVDDLAALVRSLVRYVPDDKQIKQRALDYLSRHGLMGSPLRDEAESKG